MTINGEMYDNKAWLRLSGMFLSTAIVMLIVAVGAIVVDWMHNKRAKDSVVKKKKS